MRPKLFCIRATGIVWQPERRSVTPCAQERRCTIQSSCSLWPSLSSQACVLINNLCLPVTVTCTGRAVSRPYLRECPDAHWCTRISDEHLFRALVILYLRPQENERGQRLIYHSFFPFHPFARMISAARPDSDRNLHIARKLVTVCRIKTTSSRTTCRRNEICLILGSEYLQDVLHITILILTADYLNFFSH